VECRGVWSKWPLSIRHRCHFAPREPRRNIALEYHSAYCTFWTFVHDAHFVHHLDFGFSILCKWPDIIQYCITLPNYALRSVCQVPPGADSWAAHPVAATGRSKLLAPPDGHRAVGSCVDVGPWSPGAVGHGANGPWDRGAMGP
jgi:hypothetical protein